MIDEKRIVLTESGKCRFDLLVKELSEDIRAELVRRKHFSDQETEVSRSDAEDFSKSILHIMLSLRNDRQLTPDLVVKLYLATGTIMLTTGIFLPQIRYWKDDPIKAMLVVTLIFITAASYSVKTNIHRRKELEVLLSRVGAPLETANEHVISKISKP